MGAVEKCVFVDSKCTRRTRCVHNLASGDLKEAAYYLDYSGNLTDDEIKQRNKNLCESKDWNGRNALHCAVGFRGNPGIVTELVTKLLPVAELRLESNEYSEFINAQDDDGITPIYLAAKLSNQEVCKLLLDADVDVNIKTNRGKTAALKLFKKLPECIGARITGRTDAIKYNTSAKEKIDFDFSVVMNPSASSLQFQANQMDFLSNISHTKHHARRSILTSPLVKTFIWLKWENTKRKFLSTRILEVVWYFLYFLFLITVYRKRCPFQSGEGQAYEFNWFHFSPQTEVLHGNVSQDHHSMYSRNCGSGFWNFLGWILILVAIILTILEISLIVARIKRKWFPMKSKSLWKFFKQFILLFNCLKFPKLLFLLTVYFNTIPILFDVNLLPAKCQYIIASLGVFSCWFHIFIQIGKIPKLKGYVKMLREIWKTLCWVFLLYASLIMAFAMMFSILLPGVKSFASPFEAMGRMLSFAIGEINFEDQFYGEGVVVPVSFVWTLIFYIGAILLLHILLINFLIGLTVTDIKGISEDIEVWETYTYLWQLYLMEWFLEACIIRTSNCTWAKPLPGFTKLLKGVKTSSVPPHLTLELDQLPKFLRKDIQKFLSQRETTA